MQKKMMKWHNWLIIKHTGMLIHAKKKDQAICRFGFPLPPLDQTMILHGLEKELKDYEKARKDFKTIESALEEMKLGTEIAMDFHEFMLSLNLSYNEYVLALRSDIKEGQTKVFLKRNTSEIRVNNYNETLLKCWEANMDIQYIIDPYACAAYIVSYISKGQRGMSKLLRQACEEAKENESDIRHQVRKVGNVFLSHIEVGAQEAAYILLQMPLRKASREFVFINTNVESERVVLLKSISDLNNMPKNSTCIEADNNIKRYQRRPSTMEKYCLAEYVAFFNVHFPKNEDEYVKRNSSEAAMSSELPEDNYELNTIDDPDDTNVNKINEESTIEDANCVVKCEHEVHFARDGSILKRRKVPRVIYSVGFNKDHDQENYYRELIMLYIPWRNETAIISDCFSYKERYHSCEGVIEQIREKFVHSDAVNISHFESEVLADYEDSLLVTELQHNDDQDMFEGTQNSAEF